MQQKQILIQFPSEDAFEQEFENNLRHGGTFAKGASGFERDQLCEVVLTHPKNGAKIALPARIVMVVKEGDGKGVGIALLDFDPSMREKIAAFLKDPPRSTDSTPPQNVHERLRGLSVVEQQKIARSGDLNERIVLERIYGKTVWELLLRNSRITIPEVARIARMGSLPRPLLELIISNATWLNTPHVRRATLTNPRMTRELVKKVLRLTPRNELRLIHQQTAYPPLVRSLAKTLVTS